MNQGGLTAFGRDVVKKVEELHMIIDLAHASPTLMDDVLDVATRPVIVSHSGVKGTCDNVRNLSDEHLKRIAERGGLVGIGFWDSATCEASPAGAAMAIRYTADLVGVDHVALGSDFDGATTMPFDTSELPTITQALIDEQFTDDEIRKIMGGNVIGLFARHLPARH